MKMSLRGMPSLAKGDEAISLFGYDRLSSLSEALVRLRRAPLGFVESALTGLLRCARNDIFGAVLAG